MKESCTTATSRDFRQRYQNTIGVYTDTKGIKSYVWIREVEENEVSFEDTKGGSYRAMNDTGVEFEFTQVPLGWFNSTKGPMFVSRMPARQYQRGISKGNTRIQNKDFTPIPVSLANVSDFLTFDKPYVGQKDWVLNKHFAMINGIMFFFDRVIGEVEGTIIRLTCTVVQQELLDTIGRSGLPFTVEKK